MVTLAMFFYYANHLCTKTIYRYCTIVQQHNKTRKCENCKNRSGELNRSNGAVEPLEVPH